MGDSKYTFNVTVQPGGTNINVVENYNAGQQTNLRFPKCMEDRKLNLLYQFLINNQLIALSTLSNNFVYMMGGTETPTKVEPIEWMGNLQELRQVVQNAFSELTERGALKMSDLERMVPFCFMKNGTPVKLPKNDSRLSSEKIANFFINLTTM